VSHKWVNVAAAAILSTDRQSILLAKRRADQHQGNLWEFPGGKLEPDEAPEAALHRELLEEIGIATKSASPLIVVEHQYSDKAVRLHVYVVESFSGKPTALEQQTLSWVDRDKLHDYEFPEANYPIIEALSNVS